MIASLKICFLLAFLAFVTAFQTSPGLRHSSLVTRRFLFGSPEPPKSPVPAKKDGGLFGGMGNMMESMKKAQELAKQAEVLQKELQATSVAGQDPTGQAVATFNGVGVPVSIKLSESLVAQGAEAASAAATQALIDAHAKSQNLMVSKMQGLYGGLMPSK